MGRAGPECPGSPRTPCNPAALGCPAVRDALFALLTWLPLRALRSLRLRCSGPAVPELRRGLGCSGSPRPGSRCSAGGGDRSGYRCGRPARRGPHPDRWVGRSRPAAQSPAGNGVTVAMATQFGCETVGAVAVRPPQQVLAVVQLNIEHGDACRLRLYGPARRPHTPSRRSVEGRGPKASPAKPVAGPP